MKIINRYVLREHIGPLVFALTALTSLLLLNYIAKRFGDLVGKGLPWSVILEFFYLSVPFTVAMTLPMAILVATLYAFSRLASENEITALRASGVSLNRLLVPVMMGAGVLALAMLAFNDQVLPRANHRLRMLQSDIATKKPTFALREQVINEVIAGRFYLRANHLEEYSNVMREVTIWDLNDPLRPRTILADSGSMAFAPNRTDLILTLHHGHMREVPRDEQDQLQRMFFDSDHIRVEGVANQLERSDDQGRYRGDREMSICEMQENLSEHQVDAAVTRFQLESALVAATRSAVTGEPQTILQEELPPSVGIGAEAPRPGRTILPPGFEIRKRAGLTSTYCAMLSRMGVATQVAFGGVQTLHAATVQQPVRGDTTVALPDTAPVVTTTPLSAQPPEPGLVTVEATVPMLTSAISAARSRIADNGEEINRFAVEIHKKFALSFACLIFALIGAPIALRFPRGGVGLVIGVSLFVFSIYYVGLIGGEALANRGYVSPFWAMWAANFILLGTAIILLARVGRVGAGNRGEGLGELTYRLRERFRRRGAASSSGLARGAGGGAAR